MAALPILLPALQFLLIWFPKAPPSPVPNLNLGPGLEDRNQYLSCLSSGLGVQEGLHSKALQLARGTHEPHYMKGFPFHYNSNSSAPSTVVIVSPHPPYTHFTDEETEAREVK